MTTLADVNKTLQDQGKTLLEQRADIGFVSFAMNEQLRLLRQEAADRKAMEYDLLGQRQQQQQATQSRVIGQRGPSDADIEDEVRKGSFLGNLLGGGLIPAMGGFLAGLGSTILRKGLRGLGGFAVAALFLPEIKKLTKNLSTFLVENLDDVFEFSDEQKNSIKTDLSDALKNGVVAGLILGPKVGLFTAITSFLFNSFLTDGENTDGNRELKPSIAAALGPKATEAIEKAMGSTIVQAAVGMVAAALVPRIISGILMLAIKNPVAAAAAATVGLVGFTFKYYTDGEFKKEMDELLEPLRSAVRQIGRNVLRTIRNVLNNVKEFLFGMDDDTPEQIAIKSQILQNEAQIDQLQDSRTTQEAREREVAKGKLFVENRLFGRLGDIEYKYLDDEEGQLLKANEILRNQLKDIRKDIKEQNRIDADLNAIEVAKESTGNILKRLDAENYVSNSQGQQGRGFDAPIVSNSGNVDIKNEGSRTSFFPTGNTAMDDVRLKHELATY